LEEVRSSKFSNSTNRITSYSSFYNGLLLYLRRAITNKNRNRPFATLKEAMEFAKKKKIELNDTTGINVVLLLVIALITSNIKIATLENLIKKMNKVQIAVEKNYQTDSKPNYRPERKLNNLGLGKSRVTFSQRLLALNN
jgi:hypothetical protein